MTIPIATVLALLLVALILFSTERIPIEVVALLLVMALVLTNTLTAGEAFAGFGNDIVITIAGLFILTGGLARTGVIDLVGRRLHRTAGDSEFRIVALIMFAAAFCAAVMKNTTTTAMFLPVVLGIAARRNLRSLKTFDAACLWSNPGRDLHVDRNINQPCREWRSAALRNPAIYNVRADQGWRSYCRYRHVVYVAGGSTPVTA